MRTTAIAIALLLSGSAIAQTTSDADMTTDTEVTTQADVTTDTDPMATDMSTSPDVTTDMTTSTDPAMPVTTDTSTTTTLATNMTPASGAIVQPGNADPERDARGIAVISDAAVVPAGFNGVTGTAVGGPLVDPATGQTVESADASYPACTATVTDNCLQTYEVGRS
jgi:hypothetical protein